MFLSNKKYVVIVKKIVISLVILFCVTGLGAQEVGSIVEKINEDRVQAEAKSLHVIYDRQARVHKGALILVGVLCAYTVYTAVPKSWKKAVGITVEPEKQDEDDAAYVRFGWAKERFQQKPEGAAVPAIKKALKARMLDAGQGFVSDAKNFAMNQVKYMIFVQAFMLAQNKLFPGIDVLIDNHVYRDWSMLAFLKNHTRCADLYPHLQTLAVLVERAPADQKKLMKDQLCTVASLYVRDMEKLLGFMMFTTERIPLEAFLERTRAQEIQAQIRREIKTFVEFLEKPLVADVDHGFAMTVLEMTSSLQSTVSSFELIERVL